MRPCKSCKHRVHVAYTVQVPFRVEVTRKVCALKPRLSPRPRKKQVKHRFNPQWKVGRPGCILKTASHGRCVTVSLSTVRRCHFKS